eukprot:1869328-Prymnesium_polylepis.1
MTAARNCEETFPVTTSDDASRSKAGEAPKKETPSRSTSLSGNSTEKADEAGRDLWRVRRLSKA